MNDTSMQSWFFAAFRALHGERPFPWQEEAFRRLVNGETLGPVDVPTGLGKTAIITVWVLALAWYRLGRGAAVSTRLVYVVNRRAVVDQATDEVERLREKLSDRDDPIIRDLRDALRLASGEDLLVSTLRGQKAEGRDWLTDPARPAIVVGTVDMIGSRLLFSAYRSSRWLRALYGGLIGQDAMIVHDEAHLEPAFDALVRSVAAMQQENGGNPLGKPLRMLSLSATQRGEDAQTPPLFDADAHLGIGKAQRRLEAKRTLDLREVKPADLAEAMAARALLLGDAPDVRGVIVFANHPDTATAIAAKLRESIGGARVAVLTGRMRGFERDALVDSPVFQALRATDPKPLPAGAAYLVGTSAGEVGIDLDATHLVSELAPLDAMAQRFGRANRRGTSAATLAVLWTAAHTDPKTPLGEQRARTLALLDGLMKSSGGDASPLRMAACLKTAEARLAMTPAPDILPLTAPLVESWSLTSLPDRNRPDRPEVAPWLHGLEDEEPEVTLVWRAEVLCLAAPANTLAARSLERAVEAMRLSPRERLRLPLSVARDALTRLTRRLKGDEKASRILLSAPRQTPELRVAALGDLDWKLLAGATLFLPFQAGGLGKDGHLDPAAAPLEPANLDVADPDGPEERGIAGLNELRVLVDAADTIVEVLSPQSAEKIKAIKNEPLRTATAGLRPLLRVPLKPRGEGAPDGEDDSAPSALVYLAPPRAAVLDSSSASTGPVPLGEHNGAVGDRARRFAEQLGLPETLCDALALAGQWHDEGKARAVWQRAVGNTDFNPARPLDTAWAKSSGTERVETLGGFRHELASLLRAEDDGTLADHPERDLIFHLIATHHGRGRPWFDSDAYEKGGEVSLSRHEESDAAQALRFHRLQRRFGPWGLAWLEAVLRAADWSVSREQAGEGAP